MITIEDYWRVLDKIKSSWGKNVYKHIDYCGLEPIRPLENFGYFCTPKNTLTFATTGGNGVHFGIIIGKNSNSTKGAIVMTVPMAEINNIIVAEDLEEFFSIGYYVGWFVLEQLAYNLKDTIDYYSKPDPEISAKEQVFLEMIRSEIPIQHKPISETRLKELEQKYFGQLEIESVLDL